MCWVGQGAVKRKKQAGECKYVACDSLDEEWHFEGIARGGESEAHEHLGGRVVQKARVCLGNSKEDSLARTETVPE